MNPRRQAAIAALGAVLVTVLFFMFALRPKLGQIDEVREQIEQSQDTHQRLQTQLDALRDAQEDRPRTIARLALANRYVPTEPDLPGFIRSMQSAATASGVELLSIAPAPPRELEGASGVQVIEVTITVRGGFFRMEDLLIRLENLERLVEIRSLGASPQNDPFSDQTTLSTSIRLEMYVAEDDATVTGTVGTSTPPPTTDTETTS